MIDKACSGCLSINDDVNDQKSRRQSSSSSPPSAPPSSCHYVIRWPSECQVLPYRIRHIKSLPSAPEVFYDITGKQEIIFKCHNSNIDLFTLYEVCKNYTNSQIACSLIIGFFHFIIPSSNTGSHFTLIKLSCLIMGK